MTEKVLMQYIRIQEAWSKMCLSVAVFMSDSHQGAQEKVLITKKTTKFSTL